MAARFNRCTNIIKLVSLSKQRTHIYIELPLEQPNSHLMAIVSPEQYFHLCPFSSLPSTPKPYSPKHTRTHPPSTHTPSPPYLLFSFDTACIPGNIACSLPLMTRPFRMWHHRTLWDDPVPTCPEYWQTSAGTHGPITQQQTKLGTKWQWIWTCRNAVS